MTESRDSDLHKERKNIRDRTSKIKPLFFLPNWANGLLKTVTAKPCTHLCVHMQKGERRVAAMTGQGRRPLTGACPTWTGAQCYFKVDLGDFPGGPAVKNPPSNAGDMGSDPWSGTKIPPVAEQLGPRATTGEPVGCSSRGHERYKPWPAAREVRADPASQIKQRKKRKWTGISGILQALGQALKKKHNCYVRKEEKME